MAGKAKKVVEASVEDKDALFEYQVIAGKHEDHDDDGTFYFVRAGESLMITKATAAKFPGKFKLMQRQAISVEATEATEATEVIEAVDSNPDNG
jgi:hypothetical protein